MKSLVAILVLVAILSQVCGKLVVYTCYELNKAYITQNLCENRSKPKMHCNGKCHLSKELKNEQKRAQSPFNNLNDKYEVLLFTETEAALLIKTAAETTGYNIPFSAKLCNTTLFSVYHPPQA